MTKRDAITDVPGVRVGQADDFEALTGCSVVLCEAGAVGGVDVRGGAPGTRETDLLRPMHWVQKVHAVLLTGGSAFGLDAAAGVVRYLEERGIGFDTRWARVPIVPAAILYDLGLGRADVRPDAAMGFEACRRALREPPAQGNAGAGMGATVGKILGMAGAMKGGIGTASAAVGGMVVGALVAVNAFGDVIDADGSILAGARPIRLGPVRLGGRGRFVDTQAWMGSRAGRTILTLAGRAHTVIGVVATDARLTKEQANWVAQAAHDGIARAIRPAHTLLDGDTLFALSTGRRVMDVNVIGAYAADVVARAIRHAVQAAQGAGGVPALREMAGDDRVSRRLDVPTQR